MQLSRRRRGISYGSLYNYDVETPLLFHGPQFQARTLARALRVAIPPSSSGRVLSEVFAPDAKGAK